MHEVFSIREFLQGRLQTFIRDSGLRSIYLEDLIRDLVVLLSSYREEDVPMFPAVFVGARREDFSAIFTTGNPVRIGRVAQTSAAASTLLKDCAPLAREGWAVFTYTEGDSILQYGVFRSARHSFSTGADEVVADLGPSVQLMMIKNCGHQSVELHNTTNGRLTAVLKVSPVHHALDSHIISFVAAATSALEDTNELDLYLNRLLIGMVQHCHGTLLGVIPIYTEEVPESLSTGIVPVPFIDFAKLHSEALRLQDANSLADLRSAECLLQGMIGCDGIVVFGCDGTVRAYRSFVKPNIEEAQVLPVDGGARRRAYELMKLRIPIQYKAVLFRSQDGETECEVNCA